MWSVGWAKCDASFSGNGGSKSGRDACFSHFLMFKTSRPLSSLLFSPFLLVGVFHGSTTYSARKAGLDVAVEVG